MSDTTPAPAPRRESAHTGYDAIEAAIRETFPNAGGGFAERAAAAVVRLLDAESGPRLTIEELKAIGARRGRVRWTLSGIVEKIELSKKGVIYARHSVKEHPTGYAAVEILDEASTSAAPDPKATTGG